MPVVGRADDHRIEGAVRQHLPVITVHLHPRILAGSRPGGIMLLYKLFPVGEPFAVHITNRHKPGLVIPDRLPDVMAPGNPAASDLSDLYPVRRRIFPHHRSRYERGQDHGSRCGGDTAT